MNQNDIQEPTVKEVMHTDVVFIEPEDEISKAAKTMKDKEIGSLIVKKNGTIRGIVTTKDIVYKYVPECDHKKVGDIMTQDLITISPKKTTSDAALIMVKKGIERLPVMEDGELVGIISDKDIIEVQPSLYLDIVTGMKLGEDKFEAKDVESEVGQCESCGNYSENLEEVEGQLICEECRQE
ncbi:MAG: cyclic nucleotide-binding/CBS domain-containing protein [Candidatus Aenigmatarchaeota archaeon]